MKRFFLNSLVACFLISALHARTENNREPECPNTECDKIDKKLEQAFCCLKDIAKCLCKCQSISRKDFKDGQGRLSKPFVIRQPGRYCLTEDIPFEALSPNQNAIRIASADVILDLCGHTLSQVNKFNQTGCTGVLIESGFSEIALIGSGGSIRDFSLRGVRVKGGTKNIQIGEEKSTLLVTNNGGVSTLPQQDGFEGGLILGDSDEPGLESFKGTLKNLSVINVRADTNSTGAQLGASEDSLFKQSSFSYNSDQRVDANEIIATVGFRSLSNSLEGTVIKRARFIGCLFNANNAKVPQSFEGTFSGQGIFLARFSDVTLQNCQCNANVGDLSQGGSFGSLVGGLFINGTGLVIYSSEFCGNRSGNQVLALTLVGSSRFVIKDSSFSDNQVEQALTNQVIRDDGAFFALGAIFDLINDGVIRNSVADNNRIDVQSSKNSSGGGFGFVCSKLQAGTILFDRVKASGNCATNMDNISLSAGIGVFDCIDGSSVVVAKSTISHNRSDSTNIDKEEDGIRIVNNSNDSIITVKDSVISDQFKLDQITRSSNGVTIIQSGKVSVIDSVVRNCKAGVSLQETQCCTIMRNVFLHNVVPVGDTNLASTNLTAQNKSFDSLANYQTPSYMFDFVVEGNLMDGFPPAGQICDNVLVTKAALS